MAEVLDLSLYAKPAGNGTLGMELAVDGIACGACIARIEGAVKRLPGVTEARLNYTNRRLHVSWTDGAAEPAQILQALEDSGYQGHPFVPQRAEQAEAAEARRLTRCLAVAGFAAMNIMLLSVSVWSGNVTDITPETRDFFHWASALIALPAAAYAGRPFFTSAWRAIKSRALNMDVPISLGVILALGMSVVETANHAEHAYFDSAIMLLFFLLIGRTLDHAMRRKTRAIAGNLAALKAETAHRFAGDELVSVPVAALKAGDRLLVKPGERVPADGIVLGGNSQIDESLITGETARRKVASGATVYAGSMNYSGALTLKVTAAGGAALIDEIEKLLDKAASAKTHVMRLADRASRIYAPLVHATAALTFVGWLAAGATVHDALVTAIAVLIITCPCALALAIPAVQVVASGALFRANVILNTGDAIERLAEVDTVIFDKTGTLTLPEPRAINVAAIDPELLELAVRLALSSRHPLAVALAREAHTRAPLEGAVEEPGQGVRAVIDGVEARLEVTEVESGSVARCAEKGVEALVVVVAAVPDRSDRFPLSWLGDVRRRLVEPRVEPQAMLRRLPRGPFMLAEQREDRCRVLALEALLHVLRGDDRVVILGNDQPRHRAHLTERAGAPRAQQAQREDEAGVAEQQLGPQFHRALFNRPACRRSRGPRRRRRRRPWARSARSRCAHRAETDRRWTRASAGPSAIARTGRRSRG